LKLLDQLKVPPVVGQNREAVAQRGSANQEIEVSNHLAQGSWPATLAAKNPRGILVYAHQLDTKKKILKCFLAFLWVTGIEDSLEEFGERDCQQPDTLWAEILNASDDFGVAVEVMNYPVSVDEITHRSDTGRRARRNDAIRIDVRDQGVSIDNALPRPCGSAHSVDVLRRNRLRNTDYNHVSVAERDPVNQIKAAASHPSADRGPFDRGSFWPRHAAIVSCVPRTGNTTWLDGSVLIRNSLQVARVPRHAR
jgi:hypothetical protein